MVEKMDDKSELAWPEDVREMCEMKAANYNVSPAVHVDDFIFRFIFDNPCFKKKSGAVNYYFSDGNNSAKKVKSAIDKWLLPSDSNLKILEFASGYGAVTRHAKDLLQPHELRSCDIHSEAVEFILRELGVATVQSSEVPENLEFPEQYDMIYVLSFFSHMPELTWGRWLQRLYAGPKEGGVVLVTTQGKVSMKYFPKAK